MTLSVDLPLIWKQYKQAQDATALRRTIEAYKSFFPTLTTEAVMQQFELNGAIPNEVGTIMPQDPEQQFALTNQDTSYVIATLDLNRSGPIVIEIPEGPYIGLMNEYNMECLVTDTRLIKAPTHRSNKTKR